MKIILFGGSFDPIHNGHINIALSALKKINADKVIFIVNNKSKNKECIADETDRLEMVKIAINEYKNFDYSDYEIKNNNNVSFTIDTVNHFLNKYKNDELFFLVGSDQFENIELWKSSSELIKKIKFVVYNRSNYKQQKYNEIIIDDVAFDISSTDIKKYNQWDKVPELVNDYINNHGIYFLERYKMFNISEKRLQHSLRTAKLCYNIMQKNCPANAHLAWAAGVYHDVCKCESQEWLENKAYNEYGFKKAVSWKVLHGPVAASYLVQKLKFNNELILNAIRRHTLPLEECPYEKLTLLDKILFCADKLEINRTNEDINNIEHYRELLNKNVNECFDELLKYLSVAYKG